MPTPKADKPWLHGASGQFCATINGKREYLGRDYKAAYRKLRQLRKTGRRKEKGWQDWIDAPFVELAAEFLEDVRARRASGTFANCQQRLNRAIRILGSELHVSDVRRFHLAKVEQKLTGKYSPSTIRDTLAVMQQVFNWARNNDLLDYNPLDGYKKPAGRSRSRVITRDEFQQLLRLTDPPFRRFLIAVRTTGCRPGEVRKLTWDMVHFDTGLWIIPQHKTVTMQKEPAPRVVPLPKCMAKMCLWLARKPHQLTDHVFLHQRGRPYTKDGIVQKIARLRKAAGIEEQGGENLVCYSNRHTYATEAVGRVSDTELAELLGHTTTRTLRRYVHLDAERLRDIQRRARGGK